MTDNNRKKNIDAQIFLAIMRAKIQIKKALKGKNLIFPESINLPRTKEIHGVPIFKQQCVRELIYLIANDKFWDKYSSAFFYKTQSNLIDLEKYRFNETPNIEYCSQSTPEKSILLRVLYAMCGINPYNNNNILSFETKINFELSKVLTAFKRVEDFVAYDVAANGNNYNDFDEVLNRSKVLLEKSKNVLFGLFTLWGGGTPIDESIYTSTHQAAKDALQEVSPEDLELKDFLKSVASLSAEMHNQTFYVDRGVLLEIWGGTVKSFNREQKEKIKAGESRIEIHESNEGKGWSLKRKLIEINDAKKFLEDKGIDWTLLNKKRLDDFSYKYIAFLEKRIVEEFGSLTMKKALNILGKNDISDNAMYYVVI